mmetsp:Transcript_16348/g.30772  ORF Transcript_16348/g.30772 Transcript_16348/m.30772 type:complete len:91 (-) Transcript_16348:126-398(-)
MSLTKSQEEAQRYVEKHGLDRLVSKMMNALLQEKPQDPEVYMLQWLAARSNLEQVNQAGLQPKRREDPNLCAKCSSSAAGDQALQNAPSS